MKSISVFALLLKAPIFFLCFGLSSFSGFATFSPPLYSATAAEPERISLWNGKAPDGEGKTGREDAFVTVHRPAKPNGASMVICPGGSYNFLVMMAEGHGIAAWLNQHGVTGIVLQYRLPRGNRFVPLLDAQRAIRLTRSSAEKWGCDPTRVGIIGFSAGGHLASTAATHFDGGIAHDPDPVNTQSCRPDFAILVYPVITMGEKTHAQSRSNLLGRAINADTVEYYSNEKQVTAETPPVFLAHAKDDSLVPADNSRLFYAAMQAHGVRGQYLELPSGNHGLNGHTGPMWEAWKVQSLRWLAAEKLVPESPATAKAAAAEAAETAETATTTKRHHIQRQHRQQEQTKKKTKKKTKTKTKTKMKTKTKKLKHPQRQWQR